MDYSNEEWIKVYTRSTASWRTMSIAARGLSYEISREMGRFTNEISLGKSGLKAVAPLVGRPWDEVEPALHELLEQERLRYDEDRQLLIDNEHLDRQQSKSSDAQRKRRAREAKYSKRPPRKPSIPTEDSSHTPSHPVTSCHDQKEEKDQKEESETRAREVAKPEPEPEPEPPKQIVVHRDLKPANLDAPLPEGLRARAQGLADQSGAPELDIEASWRSYVAWCAELVKPIDEARWTRWVNDDCSKLKKNRVRDRERTSGTRLSLVVTEDKSPYLKPTRFARADVEPDAPSSPRKPLPKVDWGDQGREACAKLAAGMFRGTGTP